MAEDFSLIKGLAALIIVETKTYKSIILLLKNLKIIMEELSEMKICSVAEILKKLTITPAETSSKKLNSRYISTVEVYNIFQQLEIPAKINSLLIKLLSYLILNLNKCGTGDASSILRDFRELKECIFVFRKNWCTYQTKLDEILMMFVKKLIEMVKDLNADNYEEKIDLFNVMRIMIVEFGKHPVYGPLIVKQLNDEIKAYYEKVNSLAPGNDLDIYTFEYYFIYLYILNEIISRIFLNNMREKCEDVITELRDVLNGGVIQRKLCTRESYLIQNILRVLDVYLTA